MKLFHKLYILLFFTSLLLNSQVSVSPYSMFGSGLIEDNGYGNNRLTGGGGIAFTSDKWLNSANPASYSSIDSMSFIFETGFYGKYSVFKKEKEEQTLADGKIRYFSFGYKINELWSMAIGIVPYSSINYTIHTTSMIPGDLIEYPVTYEGIGGINQIYSGNSIRILKGLSLGVNASFLFGSITKSETVNSNALFDGFSLEKKQHVNNFYLDYGLQYHLNPGKWKYSIGIIYGNKKELNTDIDYTMYNTLDTVNLDTEEEIFYIPEKYGIGLAIEKTGLFRVCFDMEKREWSGITFTNKYLNTRNSARYSFGAEITPFYDKYNAKNGLSFYLGGYSKQTYMVVNGTPIDAVALNLGIGVPIGRGINTIRLSLEGGKYGSLNNGLIREKYGLVNVVFTLQDTWFMKRKFD